MPKSKDGKMSKPKTKPKSKPKSKWMGSPEDDSLKELLQNIDERFKEIYPLLELAGAQLVEKVELQTGHKFEFTIGHIEAGINCLCLQRIMDANCRADGFKNFKEENQYEEECIRPLFEDCQILCFSTFGPLSKR